MRVIGVIDLSEGRAVHARGGARATYRPVDSPLTGGEPGNPLALARAYRDQLGLDELYVADLDALGGGSLQWELLRRLGTAGMRSLVDAAVKSPAEAARALDGAVSRVVVALESLPSFDALSSIVEAVGGEHVVFSLDLRDGVPIVAAGAAHRLPPLDLVRQAVRAGAGAVMVLDLARVGSGGGLDETLLGAIRGAHPSLEFLAGGGVRDGADLDRLARLGCDGALVATALLDGRITRHDIDLVRATPARNDPHFNSSRQKAD